ncbi:hypothetical protein OQA88_11983 [Cercophora sp. LCS_1]
MDSPQPQNQHSGALAEGRRIYIGNIVYTVTPTDIETLLNKAGFPQYEKIHISVDPVSGRNPGYCFVEFPTRELAEEAMSTLNGISIYDRPLKAAPCHPKTQSTPRSQWGPSPSRPREERPAFDRWGDWSRDKRAATQPEEQGPYGALKHLNDATFAANGKLSEVKRLYVGGLPKMIDQEQNQQEVGAIFSGYDVTAIGKRITPHVSTREKEGNFHYCFVDLSTPEEAERARRDLDGKTINGIGRLRVSIAKGAPTKREELNPEDISSPKRSFNNSNNQTSSPSGKARTDGATKESREERDARQRTILATNNWRSRAAPVSE